MWSVREDIDVRPAREIEAGARRQEAEGGLGQLGAALALQHGVELGLQGVQMQHVGGGIGQLLVGQPVGAPVGGLLLLGQVDAQQLRQRSFRPAAVGEGADQLGGDLGAVDRLAADAERMLDARRCRSGRNGRASAPPDRPAGPRAAARQHGPRGICTRWALPSPAESCTRHSRSRWGLSPIVSVSMATAGPSDRPAGRSPRCRLMAILGSASQAAHGAQEKTRTSTPFGAST